MPAARRNRGSVLLMAIGLLTILAILASTFLIVSNLDAQEADLLSIKAMADPIAEGTLRTAMALIAEDRYADADGPYGAITATGKTEWPKYADFPQEEVGEADIQWLATNYDPDTGNVGAIRSQIFDSATQTGSLTDTDGDQIQDAYLYRYYPSVDDASREGKFRVAVRIVDLSGKVCVNTASDGDPNGGPDTRSPALISLVQALGGVSAQQIYSQYLHPYRCGKGQGQNTPNLQEYDTECGRRLLSPVRTTERPYDPFAIGDEVYLLWSEPGDLESVCRVGRLYETIGPYLDDLNEMQDANGLLLGDKVKRILTTFNCASEVVRIPDVGNGFQELQLADAFGDDEAVYQRMLAMLTKLGLGTDDTQRKHMASSFVSNLKAYLSSGRADSPWGFSPESEGFTTYGYKGDLVITELVAKHYGPTKDGEKDWAWGCAIEFMNPTNESISVDDFKLSFGGNEVEINGTGLTADAAGGNRVVLYNFKSGDSNTTAQAFFNNLPGTAKEIDNDQFDFVGADASPREIRLIRAKEAGTAIDEVPVDQVLTDKAFGSYTRKPGDQLVTDTDGTEEQPKFLRSGRDDRLVIADANTGTSTPTTQYLFPIQAGSVVETYAPGAHSLGEANGSGPIVPGGNYPVTFQNVPRLGTSQRLQSLGELCNIHLVSSITGVTGVPEVTFGHRIISDAYRNTVCPDALTRGKLPFCPDANTGGVAGVAYAGYASGAYPDVPPGALFAEFFTNVTRHQRSKEKGRVYGRLNVNTASKAALLSLPWPMQIPAVQLPGTTPGAVYSVPTDYDPNLAVQWILNYRQNPGANCAVAGLREESHNTRAFLTPAEVAIPLASYMNLAILARVNSSSTGGGSTYTFDSLAAHPGFFEARNALYRAIADCITTRSDVFAVYIKVQYGAAARYSWYYLAVIDRSNVIQADDTPAILLFTEIQPTRIDPADQNP